MRMNFVWFFVKISKQQRRTAYFVCKLVHTQDNLIWTTNLASRYLFYFHMVQEKE